AEDGIRDGHVTGVQTCALPISTPARSWVTVGPARSRTGSQSTAAADASQPGGDASPTNETTCVTPAACNSRQRPRDGTPAIQQPDSTSVGRLPRRSLRTLSQVSHAERTPARAVPTRGRASPTKSAYTSAGMLTPARAPR